jgi:glutamyl-tRNA reductase
VEQRVRKNISVRQSEIAHAEAIIEEEIAELQDILRRRKLRTKEEVRWKKDEGQKMKDVI